MTSPLPPGAGDTADDWFIAELLLAHAIAASSDLPGMGAQPTHTPDMGENSMTAPTPPATASTNAPPAATPPAPAAQQANDSGQTGTGSQVGPHGYPENTPLAEMTVEQREAYWKHQARKHEQRTKEMSDYEELKAIKESYDALVAASQTDQERAVAEARRQGAAEAMGQVGGRLVEAYVRAAAAGRMDEERVNALLDGLDRTKFLTNGDVDTDRVTSFVHALAPAAPPASVATAGAQQAQQAEQAAPVTAPAGAPTRMPDFGQGQVAQAKPHGIEAGREIARQRFATQRAAQGSQLTK